MAKKIIVNNDLDTSDDPKLVAKVDAMMDPSVTEKSLPDSESSDVPATELETKTNSDPQTNMPPLDIFAEASSAPPLNTLDLEPPAKVRKDKLKTKTTPKKVKATEAKNLTTEKVLEAEDESIEAMPALDTGTDEDVTVKVKPARPIEYDDPKTAQAIEDIVAEESDAVLSLIDEAETEKYRDAVEQEKHGHPIFWALIAIICLLAAAMALFLMYPPFANFINSLNLKLPNKHL